MIAVEQLRRKPLPAWAVSALMAGLYDAAGLHLAAEAERINVLGAVVELLSAGTSRMED